MKTDVSLHADGDGRVRVSLAELIALRNRVARLRLLPQDSRATRVGTQTSRLYGRGMDYAESRAYQPGDDVRRLDWRLTARSGRLHTKLFQEEREGQLLILLDQHASMRFGTRARFKSVQAARAASLAAWYAVRAGERVGLMLFGGNTHLQRPRAGVRGALDVCGALARCDADPSDRQESLSQALQHVMRAATKRQSRAAYQRRSERRRRSAQTNAGDDAPHGIARAGYCRRARIAAGPTRALPDGTGWAAPPPDIAIQASARGVSTTVGIGTDTSRRDDAVIGHPLPRYRHDDRSDRGYLSFAARCGCSPMSRLLPQDLALRDIHLPPAPSWWPPAPGWWVLFGMFCLVLFVACVTYRRVRRRRVWQAQILAEIPALAARYPDDDVAYALCTASTASSRRTPLRRRCPSTSG